MPQTVSFTKGHGTGNDFVIIPDPDGALELTDDQVFNNIQKYGNTTAASIPICLAEAVEARGVKRGDLVALAAFGAGFTWGSALIRW